MGEYSCRGNRNLWHSGHSGMPDREAGRGRAIISSKVVRNMMRDKGQMIKGKEATFSCYVCHTRFPLEYGKVTHVKPFTTEWVCKDCFKEKGYRECLR